MSGRGGSRVSEHEQPDRLPSAVVIGTVTLSAQAHSSSHSAVPPCRAAKDPHALARPRPLTRIAACPHCGSRGAIRRLHEVLDDRPSGR